MALANSQTIPLTVIIAPLTPIAREESSPLALNTVPHHQAPPTSANAAVRLILHSTMERVCVSPATSSTHGQSVSNAQPICSARTSTPSGIVPTTHSRSLVNRHQRHVMLVQWDTSKTA